MIKFFQWIYTTYSAILFVLLMLIFGLFVLIPLVISQKGDKISFFFIRLWAGTWALLSGIRFEVYGLEHIANSKSYIYIFNHRSFIDAPMIPLSIPQEVRAIGKKELSRIPVFGTVIGKLAVWVDRSDSESRRVSLEKLVQFLNQGSSIVVAPEGTRNDNSETLLPFQKGAFRLSIETGIPILPMAIIGADQIMKRGSLLLSPGKVSVYFSAAINPPITSDDAVNEFTEKCRNRLEAMILAHE
ncbi:lysophospholipid acyltransferase family protein [Algoriphagus litoralis]|uniref:lysophospholipid acyltransferase family protein n=1 Tax=Algoriphagus litoralis TaxID=2202829 RepID=UPI002936FC8F|nr:lysophospholipid acyltransferase family protein [Algoriphagus litoralis]